MPSHNTACRRRPVRQHRIWLLPKVLPRDGPHLPGKQVKLLLQFPWRRGIRYLWTGRSPPPKWPSETWCGGIWTAHGQACVMFLLGQGHRPTPRPNGKLLTRVT
jgi:hypothetical protein